MKKILLLGIITIFSINLMAIDINPKQLSNDLELVPTKKVMSQWKKIFKSQKRMDRYGISSLSEEEKLALKEYLITNAKDADKDQGY